MSAMIRATALTVRFSATVVLNDIDLELARGEATGVVGRNGSGRTTLLRVLATLLRPSSGSLEIDGVDAVRQIGAARSRLAFVGDRIPGADGLTTNEYLEMVLATRSQLPARERARMNDVLGRAELPAGAAVRGLSAGLRQRLALAAALAIGPAVLVLDEPFQALDPASRSRFLEWITEVRECGTTVVAALNDSRDLAAVCERIVHLDGGRLVSPSGREHPAVNALSALSPEIV